MSSDKKIFIFHFLPLEQYPPAMNMIDYLKDNSDHQITVFTTKSDESYQLDEYAPVKGKVNIIRPAKLKSRSAWRYLNYFIYYFCSILFLIVRRPGVVLYIDTLSSFPALLYKKFLNRKVQLMVHYHEYCTPEEYEGNMRLVRWLHRMEKTMFTSFIRISQTNEKRLELFRKDIGMEGHRYDKIFFSMPNYPPPHWSCLARESLAPPVKLVYVGSLGMETMYLKELLDWMSLQNGYFTLDIYAYNIDPKAKAYLETRQQQSGIRFHGGCNYQELPHLLPAYDVGIVMYKPFSQNTIHAVSNKIMEYLAFGLDVWFSKDMIHSFEYIRKDCYPKVLPVDFTQLALFDYQKALDRSGLPYVASPYHYDTVYCQIKDQLLFHRLTK